MSKIGNYDENKTKFIMRLTSIWDIQHRIGPIDKGAWESLLIYNIIYE